MTRRKVEPLGAIISNVMRHHAAQQKPLSAIQRRWPRLVGKALAAHTRPVSLHRGRLIIHVDEPGDSFALSYRRAQLLKQLKVIAKGRVEDVVIRAGELPE